MIDLPVHLNTGDPAQAEGVLVPLGGKYGATFWKAVTAGLRSTARFRLADAIEAIADAADADPPLKRGDRVRVGDVEAIYSHIHAPDNAFCWVSYPPINLYSNHRVPSSVVTRIDDTAPAIVSKKRTPGYGTVTVVEGSDSNASELFHLSMEELLQRRAAYDGSVERDDDTAPEPERNIGVRDVLPLSGTFATCPDPYAVVAASHTSDDKVIWGNTAETPEGSASYTKGTPRSSGDTASDASLSRSGDKPDESPEAVPGVSVAAPVPDWLEMDTLAIGWGTSKQKPPATASSTPTDAKEHITDDRIQAHIERLESDPEFIASDRAVDEAIASGEPIETLSPKDVRQALGVNWTPTEGMLVERISGGECFRLRFCGIGSWTVCRLRGGQISGYSLRYLNKDFRPRFLCVGDVIEKIEWARTNDQCGFVGDAIMELGCIKGHSWLGTVSGDIWCPTVVHIRDLGPVPWPPKGET